MKAGDQVETYPFSIRMDPNLKGITEADLKEQFELAQKIVEKTSAANEAVIRIRSMRDHLVSNRDKIPPTAYEKTITPFLEQIAAVEEELYQVRNQSNQDPLNFPIKLNNRLASLRRSLENGDARPTDGAYKVFAELSAELNQHLEELRGIVQRELPKVNRLLKEAGAGELK